MEDVKYPNYGLQICASLNGSREAIKHGKVSMTSATGADVQALFDSVKLIMAVSAPEPQGFLSRADRKARFREQLAAASAQAQSLKLADVISNARNVRINNPKFAQTYLLEKQRDVLALSRGNRSLRNAAAKLVLAELKALQSAGTA